MKTSSKSQTATSLIRRAIALFCLLSCSSVSGEVTTDFSTSALPAAINLDLPNGALAAITLDTANDELDFTTTGNTDMWGGRANAPIAWTSRPSVSLGQTWYVETFVRFNGASDGAQRVAGITLWPGPDGTGGASGGMDFGFGLNDWNNRGVEFQTFGGGSVGDSGVGNITATGANESQAYLRLEVTENGTSDSYIGYWRADANDPWIEFTRFNSSVNNSRVGLFFKNGNSTGAAERSVSFGYFDVRLMADITDPTDSEPDGMGDNWEAFYFGDLSREGTLDFDNDGRSDLQEWQDGTNPIIADSDDDGLSDGQEASIGTDPLDSDSDDDGWDDGDEVAAGTDPKNETSLPTLAPAPEIYASLPMPTRDAVVVFNEIHYHPAGDDLNLEFIELHNQLAADVDLSNWRLDGDVDFDFPEGTVIPGWGYLVIAKNPAALGITTGHSGALGPFDGTLSNSGGRLRLYNNNRSFRSTSGGAGSPGEIRADLDGRRIMDEIEYRDVSPWPVGPDGSGSTLAKRDPATGTPHQANWSASVQPNGTPGFINAAALKPSVAINEITATTDAAFRLELFNYGTAAVSLEGMVIASSDPANADYVLPVGSLAPGASLTIDSTTLGFSPTDNSRLFLFGIGKVALIDAVRADDRAQARTPNGTGRWLRPDVATFGAANSFAISNDVVINEIFYHAYPQRIPFAERDEEWLELYNGGTSPVDLTGWTLDGGIDYDFPFATSIPAGGYLVIAKDAAALSTRHPAATIVGDFSKSLGNGGDLIVLEDPSGNPVDEVRYYDSSKWHAYADGGGSSLELLDPESDNRFAGAWAASDETSRSSWQTYTYEGVAENDGLGNNVFHEFLLGMLEAGELLLDDVSVIETPSGAAIEFIQNGDFEGDTPGAAADKWRAVGTHGSHGKTVVVTDPDDPGNQCLHLVASAQTEDKHNKLETTFNNGQTIVIGNTYRITFRAKWLGGSNLVNTRLYFNYLQRTTAIEVPDVWGTPGLANSTAVANAGPVLTGLSHTPTIPEANEAVTVRVDAFDSDGINDPTLFYSVNTGPYQSVAMSSAGGGSYSGIIPGQSSSRVVRFYVRCRDTANATSFLPAAATDGGAFYKVQDGLADTSGIRHNFRIVMAEADRQLLFLNTNRMSNDRIPVTVIENESTVYHDVALRLKASPAGRYGSGYGFNIRFQPDQLFRGVHETIAIERTGNLTEVLAKHLMNRASGYWSFYDDAARIIGPSPSSTSTNLGIGLLSMARHTGNFWDGLFPDEPESGTLFNQELLYSPNGTTGGPEDLKIGNPYNHNNGRYDFANRGSDKEIYRWGFQIRSARGRDDYSQIVTLNQIIGSLSGEALRIALEPIIDADQWMRTFAGMALNGTDDVYGQFWEHNFRFYVRPTDGKIIALQWDLDRAFRLSSTSSLIPSRNNQGTTLSVSKLFAIPQYRRMFDGHLDDLIATTFNSSYVAPWAAHFNTLTGATNQTSYITNRAAQAQTILPANVTFAITSNNGGDFSVANSNVILEGDAWVDVFEIRANGIPLKVTWTDRDRWQIEVPIGTGTNPLTIAAFNNRGTEIASDTITVTNTSSTDLANRSNTIINELHYHPTDPSQAEINAGFDDADFFEFVELTNVGTTNINLTKVAFTDGITFTFPAGSELAPGARLIVASNQAAFEFRYGLGSATIAGTYNGNLRNSGEHIRLESADTLTIADFTYGDSHPWPESSDGDGYSLIFTDGDPENPQHWRPSTAIGGNPGTSDSVPFAGGDLIDYALSAAPEVEIVGDSLHLVVSRELSADDVEIFVELSPDLITWTQGGTLISSINQGNGAALETYLIPNPPSTTPRQFTRVRVQLK